MQPRKLAGRIYRRLGHTVRRFHPRRVVHSWRWFQAQWRDVRRRRREPRLTVGIDIAALWEPLTGVGWYIYQLLIHLAERDDIRLRLYGPTLVPTDDLPPPVVEIPTGPALETVAFDVTDSLCVPASILIRVLRRLQPLLIVADRNRVLFAPNYFLPRRFRIARGRLVITVLDLGFRKVPWTLREETLAELEQNLEKAIGRAEHLITISEAVRQEIIEHGYGTPERVTAIHLGPGQLTGLVPPEAPALEPVEAPGSFALFVGTLEPRKNLGTLLTAWSLLRQRGSDPPPLVLCGRYGWKSDEIRAQLERAEAEGWARHLGYVDDRRLAELYRTCRLVAFPSIYEGFGLPAVEAMHAGAPLICSDIPVLREVAGEAALYADAEDPEAWAVAIERLLVEEELPRQLIAAGHRRARGFSWGRAADETAEVWKMAAARSRGGR